MLLLLVCGGVLRRSGILPASAFSQMNQLCFYLLLPASLFNNIVGTDTFYLPNNRFLFWLLGAQLVILAVLFALVPRVAGTKEACASIIQAGFRSNFLIFGLSIAGALCEKEELFLVSVAAGILIPLYNIGGILILQHYCGGETGLLRALRIMLRNPFVIACFLGLIVAIFGIPLPQIVTDCSGRLGNAATTVSFLALGGCIEPEQLKQSGMLAVFGTLLRLVLLPAIIIGISVLMGFKGAELITIVVMMISPTAVATFPLAQKMGADSALAGYLVITQTLFSVATIFLWLWLLMGTGIL